MGSGCSRQPAAGYAGPAAAAAGGAADDGEHVCQLEARQQWKSCGQIARAIATGRRSRHRHAPQLNEDPAGSIAVPLLQWRQWRRGQQQGQCSEVTREVIGDRALPFNRKGCPMYPSMTICSDGLTTAPSLGGLAAPEGAPASGSVVGGVEAAAGAAAVGHIESRMTINRTATICPC